MADSKHERLAWPASPPSPESELPFGDDEDTAPDLAALAQDRTGSPGSGPTASADRRACAGGDLPDLLDLPDVLDLPEVEAPAAAAASVPEDIDTTPLRCAAAKESP